MAVLGVLALALTLTVPRIPSVSNELELRAEARSVHDLLEQAAARAVAQRAPAVVGLGLEPPRIRFGKEERALSAKTAIRVAAALDRSAAEDEARFVFFPDGTASGGRIDLFRGGKKISVEVSWLTGHVRTFRN